MKNTLLIFFIAVICLNTASAQKVNIQMKAGFLSSKIGYLWTTPVKSAQRTSLTFRPTFAFSVDGQLHKGLYVGAEFGTCSYLQFMSISFKQSVNTTDSYSGWYKQEQIYFTINPQYRFGPKQFFGIGGGVGIYNNYVNTFNNGYRSTTSTNPFSVSTETLDGKDYLQPNTTVGGFINAIMNPQINNVGFVFEMRYILNDYARVEVNRVRPNIRFNSLALLGGLSFHF